MDNFSARKNNYLICESGLSQSILKNKLRRLSEDDFFEELNILSLDSFIREEAILYWPLFFDDLRPKIISRDSSIFLLQKIIADRRLFDGYFKDLNTDNISLARKILGIMERSSRYKIPVDAISHRIYRFKRGRKTKQVFDDIKNIIVEYRSVLSKNKLVDTSLIIEIYQRDFLKNKEYLSDLKEKKIFISEVRYKKRDFSRYIKRVFEDIDIDVIKESIGSTEKSSEKNFKKGIFIDLAKYTDMISKLEEIISELVLEKGVSKDEICVIIPRYDSVLESKFLDNQKSHINMRMVSSNLNVRNNQAIISCISALAIKKDCSWILKDEEKITFLRTVFRDKKSLDLIKNVEKYLRRYRDTLVENLSDVEDVDKNNDNSNTEEEFIKRFFKENFIHREDDIRMVSRLCDIISELRYLTGEIDEGILKFLKEYLKMTSSTSRKLEAINLDGVTVFNLEDYLYTSRDYKYKIIFDASSKYFDYSCESEIETELAYMDDDFLSNIDDENIFDIVHELEEDEMLDRIENLGNIYCILHSDFGVNGYEQDNRFYHLLEEI